MLSQANVLLTTKLTASQDRDAAGGWIECQAHRAEGRRVRAELARFRRCEGWVWAPSFGVLARVVFPSIRTFDSSASPWREGRAAAPRELAAVDLTAIAAALKGTAPDAVDEREALSRLAAIRFI